MPVELLTPRHPDAGCHQAQTQLLHREENPAERARMAQTLRWGNAMACYYHHHEATVTETDFLEWVAGLPASTQVTMRALGFEELRESLPLRRYVLEKNDISLSDFLKVMLSAADWQVYQATSEAALNPWLPPIS